MLTVRSLLSDPTLRLDLRAGAGAVDREVVAAAVSELTSPSPWLQGGELVMTIGLLLPTTQEACQAYVDDLCGAGISALGLGLGADLPWQEAPQPLVDACERAGLPLLTVPDGVPFIAVTKAVFSRRAAEERRALETALSGQRALTAAALHPGGLAAVLEAHHRATRAVAVVVDPLGRALAAAGGNADALVARAAPLLAALQRHGPQSAASESDATGRREAHPLGSGRLRAALVVSDPDDRGPARLLRPVLLALLTLEIERGQALQAPERRRRGRVLERLSRGPADDVTAARLLASVGLPDRDVRAAVVETGTDTGDSEEVAADLATALPEALVHVTQDGIELAAPADADLAGVLRRIAPGRPAGLGITVRPAAVAVSLRQARSAIAVSRFRGEPVDSTEIATSRLMLQLVPAPVLRAYADAVLGPLDAADRSGRLLRSLEVFLGCNGSWEAAAEAMAVHRHTVRNRMARVEAITGKRLDAAEDRLELWLALRARELGELRGEPAR